MFTNLNENLNEVEDIQTVMKLDKLLEDCKYFREFSNTLDSLHEAL